MSARARIGVIGAGSWAVSAHIPALLAREDVELVGVCRPELDVAQRIAADHGIPVAVADHRELLAHGLDAVVVASPASLHFAHTRDALAAGAHVLCEKPMTIDPAEAWELVRLADEARRELVISFGWNCAPMVRDAVRLVRETGIGRLEHLTIHMSSPTRELLGGVAEYPDASSGVAPQAATWVDPRLSGGGYGQAQLSHALALALALTDDEVVGASALGWNGAAGVELHLAAAIAFAGGGVGVLSGGSAHRGAWDNRHDLQVRLIGSEGQAVVDVLNDIAWVHGASGDRSLDLAPGAGRYLPSGPANALADVATGSGTNPSPGRLGARTVDALAHVYASLGDEKEKLS